MTAALLAVDWGTSALRGALLAADGTVLASHAAPRGLLNLPAAGWPGVFAAEFGAWLAAHPGLPCLLAGMVGSRQGWVEAPYCPCPASLADLAARLCVVPVDALQPVLARHHLAIVPGLCVETAGIPDVLRGEETQVFGALQLLGLAEAEQVTLVLPGTHSKWVTVQRGRITGFATHMTGECYALLRQQSILARTLPVDDRNSGSAWDADALDADAFDAGIQRAQTAGGLLHHVFSVRSLALLGRQDGQALASLLSGLVIGEELRAQALPAGQNVVLVGGDSLTQRYQRGLQQLGITVQPVGAQATWCGLAALAGVWLASPGGQAGGPGLGTLPA